MSPSQAIAHYRITAKLGQGGMGEVWRATDTKLNRDVAIKILPEAFAQDADRMARFEREAQVLASLNHPNIAAIYGVEERALVMELVPGLTLAERIAQGPIPVEEALPIAKQITEALEYAHECGVVHRDLKPANIKITPNERVKVLDFGLAKAISGDTTSSNPETSPTLTMRATMVGVILGTAAYMSPEQAKGKPVDRRTDIWAFGVVLYEMLTGRQMYTGETVSETLASVIKDTPDLSALPDATSSAIRRLLRRCSEKEPRRRLQAIGEARLVLEEPAEEPSSAPVVVTVPRWRSVLPWTTAGGLVLALIVAFAALWRATRPPDRPMMRFSADLGSDAVAGRTITVAISPDGTRIVYPVRGASGTLLATRLLDQSKATILSGTENAGDPFFSPNGQWIGFFADDKMKKMSVQGGAAVALCDNQSPSGNRGASWGEDGAIIASLDARQLFRVAEAGGKPQTLALKPEPTPQTNYRWPQILPGGNAVLISVGAGGAFEDAKVAVVSLKTGQVKDLVRGGYFGRYVPSGHLIYIHQGTLFGVPFDLKRMEIRGQPVPVQDEVAGNSANGGGQLDFSRTGTLVYLSGRATNSMRTVAWMDTTGKATPLTPPAPSAYTPRLAPDGKTLAFSSALDIFTYDPQRTAMTRITFTAAVNRFPVWTPDGRHIVYGPASGGIWWTRADGSAQPERLLETNGTAEPGSFSPDGRLLAYHMLGVGRPQIWVLPLDRTDPDHPKPGKPELFPTSPAANYSPAFSPDGHWLAYYSSESGSLQVYVRPYPTVAAGGKWQVSIAGGRFPIWSRTGRELFFENDGHIMVADYAAKGETFFPGKPRQWSDTAIFVMPGFPTFDLAPDGKRVVVFPAAQAGSDAKTSVHATFLVNFFDEMRRRMP
jgi:serine/threonine-protein kinase